MRAFFQTTLSLPVLFVLDLIVIAIVVATRKLDVRQGALDGSGGLT